MAAAALLKGESDFIFHIGHVGSTLLSRLLGQSRGTFALREPALLRRLAVMPRGERFYRHLSVVLRLYARTWRADQRSLVKATSFVSDIAPQILARSPSARAILMLVAPQVFIAGILAGEATRAELAEVTPGRLARLARRLGGTPPAPAPSEGEMAVAGWACEICALAETAAAFPDRVLWLDFERLLDEPRGGLSATLAHLHGQAEESEIAAMLASPEFGRYAKAPEHPFDASLRRRILARGLREHGEEIERGLAWLNALGNRDERFATATRMAAAGRTF
ncbi:MAG: hypothetical protein ACYC8V_04320 [Caulobacteraceae bacterium]